MPLSPQLMQVLACPEDHGPLYLVTGDDAGPTGECLFNPRTGKRFAVREGIPVMLLDEADQVDAATGARLAERIASGELAVTGPTG